MKDYNYYKNEALKILEDTYGDTVQMIQAYKDIHTITNSLILIDVMSRLEGGKPTSEKDSTTPGLDTPYDLELPKQTKGKK